MPLELFHRHQKRCCRHGSTLSDKDGLQYVNKHMRQKATASVLQTTITNNKPLQQTELRVYHPDRTSTCASCALVSTHVQAMLFCATCTRGLLCDPVSARCGFLRTWVGGLIAAPLHTGPPAVLQRPHAVGLRLHRAEGLRTAPALNQAGRCQLALDARHE